MCLIVVAWRCRADLPFVVAANRDEWRERPAEPARWWDDPPGLLAGRDLRAGGTWMGVTRSARFAAVTNFRDPAERRSTARSRGTLVTEFLAGSSGPREFLAGLSSRAHECNGFNLIVGDGRELWYFGSREGLARPIEPGVHGLSNHVLDEPWPKVIAGRAEMHRALRDADPGPRLFAMLSDRAAVRDEDLPDTGVGIEWERRLSSALIVGADYGTRCSTVLAMDGGGLRRFEERTRGADGSVTFTTVNGEDVHERAGRAIESAP